MAMEIFTVGRGQEGYPERLMPFADMPSRLFVRGALPADEQKTAAIVGARICTAYGKSQAARENLHEKNRTIKTVHNLSRHLIYITIRGGEDEKDRKTKGYCYAREKTGAKGTFAPVFCEYTENSEKHRSAGR